MSDPLIPSDFHCDYPQCRHTSFVEVVTEDRWYYLCFFHFIKLKPWAISGWTIAEWLIRLPFVRRLWNWWAK